MTATTATRGRTARKLIGSLGVVGAAAAVAGMGTFGTFTDSTAPLNASVATGTLALALTPANDTASLSINATNLVPGDSLSRSVDLKNAGSSAHSSIWLVSSTATPNLLTTDTTNGLQLGIQSCSVTWTKNPDGTYSCTGGTKTTMLPTTAAVISNGVLPTPASLAPGGVDHLVITLSLPTTADNTFQKLSNSLSIAFNGTQANGTAR